MCEAKVGQKFRCLDLFALFADSLRRAPASRLPEPSASLTSVCHCPLMGRRVTSSNTSKLSHLVCMQNFWKNTITSQNSHGAGLRGP